MSPGVRANLQLIMCSVRICHDFNRLDSNQPYQRGVHQTVRAPLVCRGTADDVAHLEIELRHGLLVTLYEPDVDEHGNPGCLEVDAVIRCDRSDRYWVGKFDFAEIRYASEADDRRGLRSGTSDGQPMRSADAPRRTVKDPSKHKQAGGPRSVGAARYDARGGRSLLSGTFAVRRELRSLHPSV